LKSIEIYREPVELYKLLKFEGLASSGGEAKIIIAGGLVKVNGEIETRKRKKIVAGDVVEFDGEQFRVQLASVTADPL
jgi:ribosome-associated protein